LTLRKQCCKLDSSGVVLVSKSGISLRDI
jgi:hypothetical protein